MNARPLYSLSGEPLPVKVNIVTFYGRSPEYGSRYVHDRPPFRTISGPSETTQSFPSKKKAPVLRACVHRSRHTGPGRRFSHATTRYRRRRAKPPITGVQTNRETRSRYAGAAITRPLHPENDVAPLSAPNLDRGRRSDPPTYRPTSGVPHFVRPCPHVESRCIALGVK